MKLDSGIEIYIDSFYCRPTYAGVLIGWPDLESHHAMIADAPREVGLRLRDHPYVHNIRPDIETEEGRLCIPGYLCGAYLTGPELGKGGFGTHLVVSFFSNSVIGEPLEAAVLKAVHDLDWENLAEAYEL